jgi:hypothetical protein
MMTSMQLILMSSHDPLPPCHMRACPLSFLVARLLLCVLPSCGCPVPNAQLVGAITHAMRQDNTYDHTIDTILVAPCAVLHVANIQKAFNNTTCNKTPIILGDMLSKGSTHVPSLPPKPNPFEAAFNTINDTFTLSFVYMSQSFQSRGQGFQCGGGSGGHGRGNGGKYAGGYDPFHPYVQGQEDGGSIMMSGGYAYTDHGGYGGSRGNHGDNLLSRSVSTVWYYWL